MTLSRRKLLAAMVISPALVLPSHAAEVLSATEAFAKAATGKITLIDIRTPEEWAKTGSGSGAKRLDMRREDFVDTLEKIIGGDKSKPVALICARGVRSSRLSRALRQAGFTNIIDVPEGMLGSYAGPGWLERGLPVSK
jgi:rhodanese-related sulfurtransferase